MKTHHTSNFFACVIVAASFCAAGCIAGTDHVDDEPLDGTAYFENEAATNENADIDEESTAEDDSDEGGLCGPKCRGI